MAWWAFAAGCTRCSFLLKGENKDKEALSEHHQTIARALHCEARMALMHHESNRCPGHPSGLDCGTLSLRHFDEMLEFAPEKKKDWNVWCVYLGIRML
eukprot:SAG31_NODE_4369_length_3305_cov_2.653774_3_plen_98_part_00